MKCKINFTQRSTFNHLKKKRIPILKIKEGTMTKKMNKGGRVKNQKKGLK